MHLTTRHADSTETLTAGVHQLQVRMGVDVCSIYLLEADRSHLVLAATVGLHPESVGKVRMELHEGLAGLVAEQLRPVEVPNVKRHPRFKHFAEAGEDAYYTFLGVPLIDRELLQGVLIVQTIEERSFSDDEIASLLLAAGEISPIVSQVRERDQSIGPLQRRLWALARNMWWSWDASATSLFQDLDPTRWEELGRNPVALLSEMSFDVLDERIGDLALANRINHTFRRLQEYRERSATWGDTHAGILRRQPVAYFSAEFGIHESLPIYSGGLGVLAGDHIKSASDLGVPLVGVGLFYGQGYFRQRLDASGWQQEDYAEVDLARLPLEPVVGSDGEPIMPEIATRDGSLRARVWQAAVGRRTLLLLDSDVDGNTPEDRALTARLYGGDLRVRIRQELLLGIGGLKALYALGVVPGVFHLNEGHSAFAVLEAMRRCMEREGVDFETAVRQVARRTVFTTHTPVPAGHDRFPADLIDEHLGPLCDTLGIPHERLMGLGRVNPDDAGEPFCMTVLGLRAARRANAVSSLHGDVTRHMWCGLWGDGPEEDVPIGHITNGIHVPSWLAPQMQQLHDRRFRPEGAREEALPDIAAGVEGVSDGALWETHVALKIRLLDSVRRRVLREAARRGEPAVVLEQLSHALSQDALTIGFARRVATYKRAALFLQNPERLASLVNDPQRPIQLVIAGKAHPRDEPAKRVLQRIHELSRDARFLGKLVFLEDYDISLGRQLVQGVDVWLNNPRRPQEASGTSGQKVLLNGGLNLSVLDGWWAEAYDGTNGFAIGSGEAHTSAEAQDERDFEELLRVLSDEVVPLYYDRDPDGVPRAWTARMKRAIHTLGWRFNADRMVMDYVRHCYLPAAGGLSSDMRRR
ncbi:MAG: alpha-glucan family phosphorylase [Acidobacteria bacterium]|nr:alpha-glucan family phosphorylase [Acidobacteriota bacterium]